MAWRLGALLLTALAVAEPFRDVLASFPDTNITLLHRPDRLSFLTRTFPTTMVCDAVAYTAHDRQRVDDVELDEFRQKWARAQPDYTCVLHLHNPPNVTELDPAVRAAWRRRGSPNDPRVLVDRYKAGLLLMALIQTKRIIPTTSQALGYIPILYVDGDTMFGNQHTGINTIVQRIERATRRPSVEQTVCGEARSFRCHNIMNSDAATEEGSLNSEALAVVMSLSNNCDRGFYSHSGAILIRTSPLAGFLFDTLAQSAETAMNTGRYKMGDQAVWDWLSERVFGVDWRQVSKLCHPPLRVLTRTACLYPEFILRRTFHITNKLTRGLEANQHREQIDGGIDLVERMIAKWKPLDSPLYLGASHPLPLQMAWVCARWFNAPSCPTPLRFDPLHSFHCGDFLWHLYGCRKSMWKEGMLKQILASPQCEAFLPS